MLLFYSFRKSSRKWCVILDEYINRTEGWNSSYMSNEENRRYLKGLIEEASPGVLQSRNTAARINVSCEPRDIESFLTGFYSDLNALSSSQSLIRQEPASRVVVGLENFMDSESNIRGGTLRSIETAVLGARESLKAESQPEILYNKLLEAYNTFIKFCEMERMNSANEANNIRTLPANEATYFGTVLSAPPSEVRQRPTNGARRKPPLDIGKQPRDPPQDASQSSHRKRPRLAEGTKELDSRDPPSPFLFHKSDVCLEKRIRTSEDVKELADELQQHLNKSIVNSSGIRVNLTFESFDLPDDQRRQPLGASLLDAETPGEPNGKSTGEHQKVHEDVSEDVSEANDSNDGQRRRQPLVASLPDAEEPVEPNGRSKSQHQEAHENVSEDESDADDSHNAAPEVQAIRALLSSKKAELVSAKPEVVIDGLAGVLENTSRHDLLKYIDQFCQTSDLRYYVAWCYQYEEENAIPNGE